MRLLLSDATPGAATRVERALQGWAPEAPASFRGIEVRAFSRGDPGRWGPPPR